MRRADHGAIVLENSVVVGMTFGNDACTEHEMGIDAMKGVFGINTKELGIAGRTITQGRVAWYENEKYAGFSSGNPTPWTGRVLSTEDVLERVGVREPCTIGKGRSKRTLWGGVQTAWDEEEFAAFSQNAAEKIQLREIFDAIERHDVALIYGGGMLIGSGLQIIVVSRFSEEKKQELMQRDLERIRISKLVEASGIHDKLRKADKRYFFLGKAREENGTLTFFLNPQEQSHNRWGWFTLEDLELWIEGKGPIPIA